MSARPFLDSNILIYAFSADPRRPIAQDLLAAGGIVSVQVLNEFVNVSRKKLGRSWDEIAKARTIIGVLVDPPIPLTMEIHASALAVAKKHRLAFYDGLIVAAAMHARCHDLFTEDMHHGLKIGGLVIRNPFVVP